MGIFVRIRNAISPRTRMFNRLAVIAGRQWELAELLKKHVGLCNYINIKSGLARLAESQDAQVRNMRALLSAHGVWARLPERPVGGASNWERLSGDLALLVEVCRDLNLCAVEAESIDNQIVTKLREIAAVLDRDGGELRDLALKCDPHALN
ncbi:MAG: hypothetical protein ACREQ4_17785 [Candidatus Binataceae bacterium]